MKINITSLYNEYLSNKNYTFLKNCKEIKKKYLSRKIASYIHNFNVVFLCFRSRHLKRNVKM